MKIIVILSLLILSACALPITNSDDIILNAESYLNQQVTITVSPREYIGIGRSEHIYDYFVSSKDREGKPETLLLKYDKLYCGRCRLTGVIKSYDVCECTTLQCEGSKCEPYMEEKEGELMFNTDLIDLEGRKGLIYSRDIPANECSRFHQVGRIITVDECIPSTIRPQYFLEVTEVVALD